jgi:hypothetical protein
VAVALLNKNLTAGHFDGQIFYESNSVFKQLDQSFPDEAMTWLRERLATGSDRAAGIAAYELSVTGDLSDSALIQSRLQRLRNQWKGRESEVATSEVDQPPGQARQAETDMASALASYEARTKVDGDRRRDLGQGCMSDMCRFYLK